ncbi:hypothetical protein HNQ85_003491 [Anoxybacillus calidus]|jgi:hypothetical protein|uniref:Uncharacterized protein n=1 Tax=[Anoxybacillus] calidus TaxID=575178 RepID=A0A7V9Z319_9BACL|nr:hypothetical protein [Anoxybacillus calidus]MBA2873153.1 hypothetical protein [Anoxybacillus calidus]
MSVIDQLELIDGYFDEDSFYMRGIAGFAIEGRYKANGLRSLARLIHENEPFNIIIDSERTIFVPVELNAKLKQELFMIADELELQ